MKNTYSIRKLIALLINKLWLLLVVTILFGAGAFVVSKFLISPRYESFTTMYVKNSSIAPEKETSVALNDLYASKSLASTYMTVLSSNAVMEQVGNHLTERHAIEDLEQIFRVKNKKISISSIKQCFSMTAVNETEVIKITANTTDPAISAEICNIMADIAPEFLIRVVGAGSVEIIDRAVPEKTPVSPNVPLVSLIGAIIGFSMAVFFVLLIDYFDDTIKDSDELSKRYNKAILGEVQTIELDNKSKNKSRSSSAHKIRSLLTDEGIPFSVVESYKTIRSNVVFTLGTSQKKVIAVSSANPGEGKSTTAANIAIALGQTGSSVLLIDADMRKPVLHKIFKLSNTEGLSTLIISASKEEDSVKKNVARGLDVLPSGPIPPNPSELLSSDRFKSIIDQFSKKYDYVIIDTPPVNVVSDAMVLKDSITGILMVLKYSSTTYEDLTSSMKQMQLVKANILGFVLNEIYYSHVSRYSYYRYYGKYGYSYGDRKKSVSTDNNDKEE